MLDTQEEKESYINKLFGNVELFEWDVLHISSNIDRIEVMEVIAQNLVCNTLKNEINFLYVKNVEDINLKKIKGAIFTEIMNEWLYFCEDALRYPKKDALIVIKQGERVKFVYSIVNDYFDKFNKIIFSKMVDTFLEYFDRPTISKDNQLFIDKVLHGKLNAEVHSLSLRKFTQLNNRIKIAQSRKSKEIFKISMKIKELTKKLNQKNNVDFFDENDILLDIEDYEYDIEDIEKKGLYEFDDIIANLRNNLINGLRKLC